MWLLTSGCFLSSRRPVANPFEMSYRATNSTTTTLLRAIQNTSAIPPRCGTKVLCCTKTPSSLSSRDPPRTLPPFPPVARRPVSTLSFSSTPRNTTPLRINLRLPRRKPSHNSALFQGRFFHDLANNKKVQAFLDARENLLKSWKVAATRSRRSGRL